MQQFRLRVATGAVLVLMFLNFSSSVLGQALVDGQVMKVDEPAKKITLKHGPFKKFDMDEPMTMVYAVKDPAMLKSVKAGDKVKFDAERINGQFTITVLQKVK